MRVNSHFLEHRLCSYGFACLTQTGELELELESLTCQSPNSSTDRLRANADFGDPGASRRYQMVRICQRHTDLVRRTLGRVIAFVIFGRDEITSMGRGKRVRN